LKDLLMIFMEIESLCLAEREREREREMRERYLFLSLRRVNEVKCQESGENFDVFLEIPIYTHTSDRSGRPHRRETNIIVSTCKYCIVLVLQYCRFQLPLIPADASELYYYYTSVHSMQHTVSNIDKGSTLPASLTVTKET
jgi:hypothetical protein